MSVKSRPCRLTDRQCQRVYAILNAGRRKLLAHVRTRARTVSRTDAIVARETLRVAMLLYGFGKPLSKKPR